MDHRLVISSGLAIALVVIAAMTASASQLIESTLETTLLPGPVEFNMLLPEGYDAVEEPLPLLLFLHGGGGDRTFLTRMRSTLDGM